MLIILPLETVLVKVIPVPAVMFPATLIAVPFVIPFTLSPVPEALLLDKYNNGAVEPVSEFVTLSNPVVDVLKLFDASFAWVILRTPVVRAPADKSETRSRPFRFDNGA